MVDVNLIPETRHRQWNRHLALSLAPLLGVVLLGLALRVYGLERESIWTDEAMSIRVSRWSLSAITTWTAGDVHPPLYYYALHAWMRLFGTSVAAVRLLSAIFGILTIPLIYRAGSRIFDSKTGLVAALLLATATFHVAYAQEARMYSLLALLSLWSMLSSFEVLRDGGRRAVIGYAVATALMLYTHVYGVFVVAAELGSACLLFAFDRGAFKRAWKSFAAAQALTLLFYLPWLIVLVRQVSQVEHSYWIPRPGVLGIWLTLSQYAGSWALSKTLRVLALLAAGAGLVGWRGNNHVRWAASTLLLWIAGPVLLPWLVSQFSTPIFLVRCTIAASLAFYLLAARGATLVPGRWLRAGLLAAILAMNGVAVRGYQTTTAKDQWREAAAGIGARAQSGDLLLFCRPYGQMPFDYYSTRRDLRESPCPEDAEGLPLSVLTERIDQSVDGHARVWLVVSNPDGVFPVALERLNKRYIVERTDRWRGIRAYLFVGRSSDGRSDRSGTSPFSSAR